MRYVKIFLTIIVFFLVMLFFVQNQASLSQSTPLTFDLFIFQPLISKPVSIYVLLLVCFLLGGIVTLFFLIWDRIQLSTRLAVSTIRIKTLEHTIEKLNKEKNSYLEQAKEHSVSDSFLES